MKVSIVVPVYNAEKTINDCLASLTKQSYPPDEIIVVDNNSTDKTPVLIKKFIENNKKSNIILTREFKKGPATVRNKGIGLVKGDIVAFTDSDCIAHKDWIKDIRKAFDDEDIGGVAGNIFGYRPVNLVEKFLSIFTLKGLSNSETFDKYTLLKGGFPTANLSFKKDVLKEIKGFDKSIRMYGEDHDLCARVYNAGFKIKYVTNAVINHTHRTNIRGLIKQSFGFGLAHAYLLKKHFKRMFILELPKITYQNPNFFFRAWFNLNLIDKKLILLILIGLLHPLLFSLLLSYLIYLVIGIGKKCRDIRLKTSLLERIGIVLLLIVKSGSMTWGRIYGSCKYRVICF